MRPQDVLGIPGPFSVALVNHNAAAMHRALRGPARYKLEPLGVTPEAVDKAREALLSTNAHTFVSSDTVFRSMYGMDRDAYAYLRSVVARIPEEIWYWIMQLAVWTKNRPAVDAPIFHAAKGPSCSFNRAWVKMAVSDRKVDFDTRSSTYLSWYSFEGSPLIPEVSSWTDHVRSKPIPFALADILEKQSDNGIRYTQNPGVIVVAIMFKTGSHWAVRPGTMLALYLEGAEVYIQCGNGQNPWGKANSIRCDALVSKVKALIEKTPVDQGFLTDDSLLSTMVKALRETPCEVGQECMASICAWSAALVCTVKPSFNNNVCLPRRLINIDEVSSEVAFVSIVGVACDSDDGTMLADDLQLIDSINWWAICNTKWRFDTSRIKQYIRSALRVLNDRFTGDETRRVWSNSVSEFTICINDGKLSYDIVLWGTELSVSKHNVDIVNQATGRVVDASLHRIPEILQLWFDGTLTLNTGYTYEAYLQEISTYQYTRDLLDIVKLCAYLNHLPEQPLMVFM